MTSDDAQRRSSMMSSTCHVCGEAIWWTGVAGEWTHSSVADHRAQPLPDDHGPEGRS